MEQRELAIYLIGASDQAMTQIADMTGMDLDQLETLRMELQRSSVEALMKKGYDVESIMEILKFEIEDGEVRRIHRELLFASQARQDVQLLWGDSLDQLDADYLGEAWCILNDPDRVAALANLIANYKR